MSTTTTDLAGEVITWAPGNTRIAYDRVLISLESAGLDKKSAKEMSPRNAFSRCARSLEERSIIRKVREDTDSILFQLTKESLVGDELEYDRMAVLTLYKETGNVHCPDNHHLAERAKILVMEEQQVRTSGDVTRIVQKLFSEQADLFPIREQGGAYFVPIRHQGFVDKVEKFLNEMGGKINRFPVPSGTAKGDTSIKHSVADGLKALLHEYEQAIERFDEDTRSGTFDRAATKLEEVGCKILAYEGYLRERADDVRQEADRVKAKLREKLTEKEASKEGMLAGVS